MVKLKGAFYSLAARGTFAKKLVYSVRKTGNIVRIQKKQDYAGTEEQLPVNTYFKLAITAYSILSDANKAAWDTFNQG